jgi:hypothetical protein
MKNSSTQSTDIQQSSDSFREAMFSEEPFPTNHFGSFCNTRFESTLSMDDEAADPLKLPGFSETRHRLTLPNSSFKLNFSLTSGESDSFGSLSSHEDEFPMITKKIEKVSSRKTDQSKKPIRRRKRVKKPKVLRAFIPSKKVTFRDKIVSKVGKKRIYGDNEIQKIIPNFTKNKKDSISQSFSNFSNLFTTQHFCAKKNLPTNQGLLDFVQPSLLACSEQSERVSVSSEEANLPKVGDILGALAQSRHLSLKNGSLFEQTSKLLNQINDCRKLRKC